MTQEQMSHYTLEKNRIDSLHNQLSQDIDKKQQQIAGIQKEAPNYSVLHAQLIALQRRRCVEPNTDTYLLIEKIVLEAGYDWDEMVRRNNEAENRNLRGEQWVKAIVDGV